MARLAWLSVVLVVACTAPPASPTVTPAPATPSPLPTMSARPTPTDVPTTTSEPTPSASTTPTTLAFPRVAEEPLVQGRYSSSPPFSVPFTFEVNGDNWESGHINADFFDLLQIDDARPGVPTRWVAFSLPTVIHGDPDTPASELTPADAAALLAARTDLESEGASEVVIAGLSGAQIDIRAAAPQTHIFGSPGGDFGLGPEHDARLAITPWDDGLLLFLVLATPGELEEAWQEALPIFDSMEMELP